MINTIMDTLTNPAFLMGVLIAVAVGATLMSIAAPYMEQDQLASRMKTVALEREKMRQLARANAGRDSEKVVLRQTPKEYMANVVAKLNLRAILADEHSIDKLRMAGYRGDAPLIAFLFARLVAPIGMFIFANIYLFLILDIDQPPIVIIAATLMIAYLGFYLPILWVSNQVTKRQQSIRRSWPDALDLMLICVESGMSIENAFRKVAEEIGIQSIALAEELSLTTAELSYLDVRRKAYENLAKRTGLEPVKSVATALIQAERYGTPLGVALRTLAQESRDQRMNDAEKKAAALPPKLTVPMMIFFLPVLFIVILGPGGIEMAQRF